MDKTVKSDGNMQTQSSGKDDSASKRMLHKLRSEMEESKAGDELKFSLKQLIRKLHIVEPVENVMCLVGKRLVVRRKVK